MDMPSSVPVGSLIDRSATGVVPSQSEARLDQAKFLHHAGSPWFLALTALGVVYGDIGTSPLYAFSGRARRHRPSGPDRRRTCLGIVSLIFWALMAMVSLKYVIFVLRADNDGEGGILALLSLVGADQVAEGVKLPVLVLLGVVGASLLYGDGVITPAISVLSAMEGLKLVAPGFEKFIVPVTLVILIGLFVIQRRGTESIGRLFGPVMVVWFVVIGVLGAANIFLAPVILQAVNPLQAARFLIADPIISFAVIGAVFLALTGGEALYADMGHVGASRDPPGLVRLGAAGADAELFRPGRADPCRPGCGRQSVLQAGARLGADPDGGARRGCHHHRVAGADLRRVLADAAGDADGIVPAREDRADLGR